MITPADKARALGALQHLMYCARQDLDDADLSGLYQAEREIESLIEQSQLLSDLVEALEELADLMQGVIDGDYKPDSFTLQVANAALAAHDKEPTMNDAHHGPHCAGSCEGAAYQIEIRKLRAENEALRNKMNSDNQYFHIECQKSEIALLRSQNDALREYIKMELSDPTELNEVSKIWACKVGECSRDDVPWCGDTPMREAVEKAYYDLTGKTPDFMFSGWGAKLAESERAVVEDREPRTPDIWSAAHDKEGK